MRIAIISTLILIFIIPSRGQEAAIQLGILNSLTKSFKEAEAAQDKVKMAKLAKQIQTAKKTFETTKKIYEHYQNALEAVETVSSLIKTANEVKEFYEYVIKISDAYSQYGIGYKVYSLYDLDAPLNPEQHDLFMMTIKKLYDESLKEVEDMRVIISNKAQGGASATEYERWIEILRIHENIREINQNMEVALFYFLRILPVKNRRQKNNIQIMDSFFDYETYAD